ncbi:hypothetical protein ACFCX0_23770 [Streptomyces sp. NPDC056352]|uniref:hypothetical protein n=1 Tax=Streptomyces sp. NPDC056352 TaxID=3345791 RepID=UPI0035DB1185
MPAHSACARGAQAASVTQNYGGFGTYHWQHRPTAWPAADISAQRLARLPVQEIVVATDGSTSAIERARTILANTYPDRDIRWTVREDHAQSGAQLAGYRQLANVVVLVSFPIAGCSLAVSVAGGLRNRCSDASRDPKRHATSSRNDDGSARLTAAGPSRPSFRAGAGLRPAGPNAARWRSR